jgi:hypothetical protein
MILGSSLFSIKYDHKGASQAKSMIKKIIAKDWEHTSCRKVLVF